MKQYQKIVVFWAIGCWFSLVLSGSYMGQYSYISGVTPVFAADDKAKDSEKKADSKEGENDDGSSEEDPCPECPECPDPAKVVLRGLDEKKTMVEREHKAMIEEKKQLQIFEEQIDEKLEKLSALKKQIADDMALLDQKKSQKEIDKEAAYETQMRRLVKTYEVMKPKAAAPIIDKMNLEVAQEIFLRMKEAAASQILSFVNSEKAAKISERLAFKQK